MGTSLVNVWPARIILPDATYQSVRGLLYETTDGHVRLAVIEQSGGVSREVDVSEWRPNADGADFSIAGSGESFDWHLLQDGGCSSCGGSSSAGTAAMLAERA